VKPEPTLVPDPAAEPSLLLVNPGVGVDSELSSTKPSLELFREYGRDEGCGVLDLGGTFGPGLGVKRGAPIWLFENDAGPRDGPRPGVGTRVGCFLNGDSGLGKDGRCLGLKTGLEGRAPGPTDCENLGSVFGGEGSLRLKSWKEGVVGVGGTVSAERVSDDRFVARCIGRNMPDPGTDVVK
jgi:hypothetical protein